MKLNQICIYEVSTYKWDNENQTEGENIDCDYYTYSGWVGAKTVIKDNVNMKYLKNCVLYVYEARGGNVIVGRGGKIEYLDDVDCATGLNGSPIETIYYNNKGEEFDPYE
jgi:hypothetical protein